MKYKLININTKEETICDKVVIDGFDYYVEDGNIVKPIDFNRWQYNKKVNDLFLGIDNMKGGEIYEVIATNNSRIDIPQVVANNILDYEADNPFTEQDMIEFGKYCSKENRVFNEQEIDNINFFSLLYLWKSEQPIKIYYESTKL